MSDLTERLIALRDRIRDDAPLLNVGAEAAAHDRVVQARQALDAALSTEPTPSEAGSGPPITVFVCQVCGRYWAKSEGKQQFYCHGVGHERHPVEKAAPVTYYPTPTEQEAELERLRDPDYSPHPTYGGKR